MTRTRALHRLFPAVVLAATVVELLAAVLTGGDQFEGKGWCVRLFAYPALMLVAPVAWWLARGPAGARRRRTPRSG